MKINMFNILKKTQEELWEYVIKNIERNYKDIEITKKYVYAKGNIPVMLVAHLDTVHKELPDIYFDKKKRSNVVPTGNRRRRQVWCICDFKNSREI